MLRHVRLVLSRVLAVLFAASWIVFPGFGAIDLSVTWDPEWPQVLEAGWGLFFTVLVGAPFVLVAVRPRAARPGLVQLGAALVALVVSMAAGRELPLAWPVILLAAETAVVAWLSRPGWNPAGPRFGVPAAVLGLGALGVVPWLVYAFQMWADNRQGRPDSDVTNSVDHYAVQGALGLALASLPLLAAARPALIPFVPACAGVAAAYLGLVSFRWTDAAGGLGPGWSIVAMAWGSALVAAALVPRRRPTPTSV